MKSLENRVNAMESLYSEPKEKPAAHVAMIDTDGSVTVKKPNNAGSFELPNKKALDTWIEENGLNEDNFIRVIVVNSEGKHPNVEPPKEL